MCQPHLPFPEIDRFYLPEFAASWKERSYSLKLVNHTSPVCFCTSRTWYVFTVVCICQTLECCQRSRHHFYKAWALYLRSVRPAPKACLFALYMARNLTLILVKVDDGRRCGKICSFHFWVVLAVFVHPAVLPFHRCAEDS
jgi:hypothetical protein